MQQAGLRGERHLKFDLLADQRPQHLHQVGDEFAGIDVAALAAPGGG